MNNKCYTIIHNNVTHKKMIHAHCLNDCVDFDTSGIAMTCFLSLLSFWPFTQWTWIKIQGSFHIKIEILQNIASHGNFFSTCFYRQYTNERLSCSFCFAKYIVGAGKRWKKLKMDFYQRWSVVSVMLLWVVVILINHHCAGSVVRYGHHIDSVTKNTVSVRTAWSSNWRLIICRKNLKNLE